MLNYFAAKDGIERGIGKGKCFTIVIHIDVFIGVVMSFTGENHPDIVIYLGKKGAIWFGTTAEIEQTTVQFCTV
jgi:hypothetical protein